MCTTVTQRLLEDTHFIDVEYAKLNYDNALEELIPILYEEALQKNIKCIEAGGQYFSGSRIRRTANDLLNRCFAEHFAYKVQRGGFSEKKNPA